MRPTSHINTDAALEFETKQRINLFTKFRKLRLELLSKSYSFPLRLWLASDGITRREYDTLLSVPRLNAANFKEALQQPYLVLSKSMAILNQL